jgi:GT2 family glycosyltransferase
MTKVAFPPVERPTVSVVMVVYGGWQWVREALLALIERTPPCYEVILVDNASPDGTGDRLDAEVSGARLVRNADNVGFGAGANQGALHAVGRHLLFLNSDAFVQPGWLPPLLEVLDADPLVAAVTPRLVDPDGTLQEAGGVVARDGFAGQLGMGARADALEFAFRRRIDFSSAAALMVRRRHFVDVGGFHPAYAMGYFEDVDLCLTFWERGLATVYEPRSTVLHLRGASGTEELAQRYALANHSVLMSRWSGELQSRPSLADLPTHPHRRVASRDARATDRVLLLADRGPAQDSGGWDAHVFRLVAWMAEGWPTARFTVAVADTDGGRWNPAPLSARGVEVAAGEDWEKWFAGRLFHYSSVMSLGAGAFACFDDVARRTQPQALLALALDRPLHDPAAGRAADGSSVILCLDRSQASHVAERFPHSVAVVLPPPVAPVSQAPSYFERVGVAVACWPEEPAGHLVEALRRLDPDLALTVVPAGAASGLGRSRVAILPPPDAGSGSVWRMAEAVGTGLPIVTTPVGAEDLDLGDLAAMVVGDGAGELAGLACTLHADQQRWDVVHRQVAGLAATTFGEAVREAALVDAMAALGLAAPDGPAPTRGRRPVRTGPS